MGKIATAIIVIATVILTALPAIAAEVIVPMDHYPPWKIVENNRYSGIDVELITALLREVGITPTFTTCPWSRCLDMIKSGEAAMLSGVLRRPEREKFMFFIDPPYKTRSSKVFYTSRDARDIRSYDDLYGRTIGVQRGAKYFDRFDNDRKLTLDTVANDELNFRKLLAGRVDAVIITESIGDYVLSEMGLSRAFRKATFRHDREVPVHFVISRNSPLIDRGPELNRAAKRLRESGEFERIIRDFFKRIAEKGTQLPAAQPASAPAAQ